MSPIRDYPLLLFVLALVVLWLSTRLGALASRAQLAQHSREDLGVVLTSTLALLGLIIGFSFSMAVGRYDQRKNFEEAEANAIGTEYVRLDLLSSADAAKVRPLLSEYLDQRILFYSSRDKSEIARINIRISRLQEQLWAAVLPASRESHTPIIALVVAGMNDVLNSQGYTQAAWLNRIPPGAWILMVSIAIAGTLLMGYGARNGPAEGRLLLVLPCVLSITFLLIADIDCPNGGLIRVRPQNLLLLAESLHAHPP
jgi:hypothetical protein